MAAGKLPQTSDSQDIGERARICLTARRPHASKGISWRLISLEGTDDFGLDFQVHTAVNQEVTDTFFIQLKGTESPKTNAADTHIAIQFETSTLRLYARISKPILLVLCDLSAAPDPVDCPLYYVWAHEELRRIALDSLPGNQEKATVHFPKANRITAQTDFGAYLQHHLEVVAAARALDVGVAQARPNLSERERLELIKGVGKGIVDRSPALLDALAEPPQGVWIEPTQGSLAWHLRQAQEALRNGRIERAANELQAAEAMLPAAATKEAAIYWLLRARTSTTLGDHATARAAFQRAKDLDPTPKHVSAWAESELRARRVESGASMKDVEDALVGDDPALKSARARLLAVQGRFDESNAVLDSFTGEEALSARAVVCMMQNKPELVLAACEAGLALPSDTKDSLRPLFLLLRARARFMLAAGQAAADYPGDYVPPSGVPGVDVPMLKKAWGEILEVVQCMNDTGWPSNGEFVADIWASTASMLGKQQETLPALAAAAKARPHIASLQSATESMAAQIGDFKLALEANARLPDCDIKHLRRIIFLHQLGRHRDCVRHVESHLHELDRQHEHFGPALAIAALSAHKLLRTELVGAWRHVLGSQPALVPHQAVLEFMLAKEMNRLDTSAALAALQMRYRELGQPMAIALALFEELDPTDPAQAQHSVEVAARIQKVAVLPPSGAVQLGTALAALKRWEELLSLAKSHRDQFDPHTRMRAFEALALDRVGRTGEARAVLEQMIDAGMSDQMALNIYVNIMIRCGFTTEAMDVAERILESARNRREQMGCIRLLFNLEQTSNPKSARLLALAQEMGKLVDREDEAEEGVYLVMMLSGTSTADVAPTADEVAEFQRRADAFFDKWPDSNIIRQVQIREDASADELLASLNKLVGTDPARLEFRRKLETQLQQGTQPIPFAWRPKLALSNVHDVVHLWEVSKTSHADDRKYHLTMTGPNWQPVPLSQLQGRIPLLDLTALLVLDDLGLLDRLFDVFPKVAAAQGTLEHLASLIQVFSGSPASRRCVQLQDSLKTYMDRIEQPSAEDVETDRFGDGSEEIAVLCRTGRYTLYSDDVLFRIYAAAGSPLASMCTCDLLAALEEAGLIDESAAARCLAALCQWHVGLSIEPRHQLAAVPPGLHSARSVQAGVDVLAADQTSSAIVNAVWDIRGDFKAQAAHVSGIIRMLVQQPEWSSRSVAAYASQWFSKAALRPDVKWDQAAMRTAVVSLAVTNGPALDDRAMRKLWDTYLDLVSFHFGDRMDEVKERDAIEYLATQVARTDQSLGSDVLRARFAAGLTPGTAWYDRFQDAYSNERVRLGVDAAKKRST